MHMKRAHIIHPWLFCCVPIRTHEISYRIYVIHVHFVWLCFITNVRSRGLLDTPRPWDCVPLDFSGVGFCENLPFILLQLPVSPAAKQAIEEKRSGGDTPQAPRQGLRPLHSRLKGGSKKPTRENPPAPPPVLAISSAQRARASRLRPVLVGPQMPTMRQAMASSRAETANIGPTPYNWRIGVAIKGNIV